MSELIISLEKVIKQVKFSYQFTPIIEGIAARQIVATVAQEKGIKVEAEELQKGADSIRLANQLFKPEDTWSWLAKNGLSLDEFEELVHHQILASKLAMHLFSEQVEPFFVANQLNWTRAAIYEVVLDDQDLAMELFYALSEEEISFPEVAHQYIENPEIRRVGGYRGLLNRKQLKPEISSVVFAATPPQILRPIVTSVGVHVILVGEIIPPKLNEQSHQQILGELFNQWLKTKISKIELIDQTRALEKLSSAD
ncbi:peptidylprolyl isomerase [Crocosphaera sp. XPORK-15E]|uniref:peptidylprolyl isomerase n=1 Tax=Crocosphaera sp. XPORK-15E TaxID=3110247 RepID=UPI002B21E5F6|nr:peptidylprolyl isomerase [Crocosphaera sp. XPORK-15E]MEA5536363.1 peptidylprolyl isomerase [Crocosphaera sp. XPORK-15E]